MKRAINPTQLMFDEEFESKHPRQENGKFGAKGEANNIDNKTIYDATSKIRQKFIKTKNPEVIQEFNELVKNKEKEFYATNPDNWEKLTFEINMVKEKAIFSMTNIKMWLEAGNEPVDISQSIEKLLASTVLDKSLTKMQKGYKKSTFDSLLKQLGLYPGGKDKTVKRIVTVMKTRISSYAKYAPDEWKMGDILEKFFAKENGGSVNFDEIHIDGYTKSDGTEVSPHTRHIDGTKSATQAADMGSEYREVKLKGWDSKALDDIFTNINDNYDEWKASGFTPTEAYQLLDSEVGKYEDDGETIISPDFAIEMKEAGYEVDEIIDAVEEARKDYNDDDYQIIMDKAQEILDKKEKNIVTENIEDDIDVDDLTAVYVEKLDPSYQSVFKSEIDDLFTDKGDDAVEEYVKQVKTYQREKLPPVFAMRALLADKPAKTAKAIYDMVQESEFTVDWHDDLECAHFFRMINKFRDYSDKGGKFSEIVKLKHKVTGEVFFAEYGSADELRAKGLIPVKRKNSKDGKGEYFGRKKRAVKLAKAMKKVKDAEADKKKESKKEKPKRKVYESKDDIPEGSTAVKIGRGANKGKYYARKKKVTEAKKEKVKFKSPEEAIQNATPDTRNEAVRELMGVTEEDTKDVVPPQKEFEPKDTKVSLPGNENVGEITAKDYTGVEEKDLYLIKAKDILEADKPSYIPTITDRFMDSNGYFVPGYKLAEDKYLIQIDQKSFYSVHGVQDNSSDKYAIVSRDVYAATMDYYLTRAKAIKTKLAKERNEKYGTNKKAKRTSVLPSNKMTSLQWKMFENFIGRKSSYDREANKQMFAQYQELRKEIKQKTEDMEIQLEDYETTFAKGRETSYGDSNLNDSLLKDLGIKVKRQNGAVIDEDEIKQIKTAIDDVYKIFGDRSSMSKKFGLKISHSGQKLMHAMKAYGVFVPAMKAIGVSFVSGDTRAGLTLSHEFGHFMDYYLGSQKGRHFVSDDPNSIAGKIAKLYRDSMNKPQSSKYMNRTCECFARAVGQYYTLKTGDEKTREVESTKSYQVAEDKFVKEIQPLVEQFMKENDKLLFKENTNERVKLIHKQTGAIFFAEYGSREDLLKKGLVPIKRKANTDNKGEYYGRKKKSVKPGSASGNKKFSKLMLEKIKNTPAKQLPNVLRNLDPKTKAQVSKVLAGNNKATNKKTPSPKVKKMTNKERGFSMKPPAKKIPRENTVKKMTDKERGFSLGIPEAQKAKAQSSALKKVAKVLGKPLEYLAKKAGKKLFSILDRMIVIHGWMQRRIDRTEEIRKRDMGKNYGKPIEQNKLGAAFNRGVGKRAGEKGAGKRYVPGKNLKLVQNFSEQNTDEIKLVIVEYLKNLGIEDAENKANKILKSKVMQKHFPKGSVSMAEGKRIDNLTTKDWIKEFLNKDMYRKSIKPVLLAEFTNGSELLFDKNYYIQKDKEKTQLTDNQTINKIKSSIKTNDIKPYSEILKKLIQSIKEGKTSSNRAVSEQRAAKQGNINFTEGQTVILRNKVTNEVFFAEIYKDKSAVPKEKVAVRISRGKNAGKYYGRARKAAKLADAMVKAKNNENSVSLENMKATKDYINRMIKQYPEESPEVIKQRSLKYFENVRNNIESKDYNKLINTLHSTNKSSRKLFEEITGIKLGTNAKTTSEAVRKYVGEKNYNKAMQEKANKEAEKAKQLEQSKKESRAIELNKKVNYAGKLMTIKEMIDSNIKEGTEYKEKKRGVTYTGQLWNDNSYLVLRTKAEMEYAKEKLSESKTQSKQSPKPVKAEKKSTKPKRKIYDSADAVPEGMTAVKIGRGDNEGKYYARKGGKKKDEKAVKDKEPWEMTDKEWTAEFEKGRPSSQGSHQVTAANNIGKSAKGAEKAFDDLMKHQSRLKMGLKDQIIEGLQFPARHRQVIEHAIKEGKVIPQKVLKDYPDLAAKQSAVKKDKPVKQAPAKKVKEKKEPTDKYWSKEKIDLEEKKLWAKNDVISAKLKTIKDARKKKINELNNELSGLRSRWINSSGTERENMADKLNAVSKQLDIAKTESHDLTEEEKKLKKEAEQIYKKIVTNAHKEKGLLERRLEERDQIERQQKEDREKSKKAQNKPLTEKEKKHKAWMDHVTSGDYDKLAEP